MKENKLKKHLETLTKKQIIELYLQKCFDAKFEQNKIAIQKLEELYNCFNEINNVPFDCEPSIIMNRKFALHKINSMIEKLKGEYDNDKN